MNTVVIGQKWLAAEVLRGLMTAGVHVLAVCPDAPGDRLEREALAAGVPAIRLEDMPKCDLALAAHCHHFISRGVRSRAKHGTMGYHPSLLPRHRGRDAIYWTLAFGDPIAGGTVYWMDDGADTGEICRQEWCFVRRDDSPQSLWQRELGPMGVRLLTWAALALARGEILPRIPQPEDFATFEPALTSKSFAGS